jgi:hypothetical protein
VVTGWEGGLYLKGGTPAASGWKAGACTKAGNGWEAGACIKGGIGAVSGREEGPAERGKVGRAGTCIRVFLKSDYLRH